jgi:hypothetical protein
MVAEPGPASDLANRIRDDLAKWREVASRAGIKPE